MQKQPITLLHISDTQFGKYHRFGSFVTVNTFDSLLTRLTDDLRMLKEDLNLCPQAVVLTGDIAEQSDEKEFDDALKFVEELASQLEIPRNHFAIIPGNHDIHRNDCKAYFNSCTSNSCEAEEPFWPKWINFQRFFNAFYKDHEYLTFTQSEPWTLFDMPELKLVIAGLNSTMKESHRETDHYGHLGEEQLRSFAAKLAPYKTSGIFRIAALHHNIRRGPVVDDENLKDMETFHRILGSNINLILHGHTHDGKADLTDNGVPILATGSVALDKTKPPQEVTNQYQIIQIRPKSFNRVCRAYYPRQNRWIGDTSADEKGNTWQVSTGALFQETGGTFPDKMFNERNSNLFSDVEPFLEACDIVTAFNLILKGKPFKKCIDEDQKKYLILRQKWGFIDSSDIKAIGQKLKDLAGDEYGKTLLAEYKVLNIKILSQKKQFKKVIELGTEVEAFLVSNPLPDQLPAFRHRMAVAHAICGSWVEGQRWFDLARDPDCSNSHSRLTTDSLQAIASYFCNNHNSYSDSISRLKVAQQSYLRELTDSRFWQINGFKSSIQCLFAEAAILLSNHIDDTRGRTKLIAAHLLASHVMTTPLAEGYAELLAMIWCKEHHQAKVNENRMALHGLLGPAMHSDYTKRMKFQKQHVKVNADVYKKMAGVLNLLPRSEPTPANWLKLQRFLESVEIDLTAHN